MTFSVKKSRADLKLEPFEWFDSNDVQRFLPSAKGLTGEQLEKLEGLDSRAALLELDLDDETVDEIMKLELGVITDLFKAWMADADDELGEGKSAPSPRSSASTVRTLKPTSKGSTKNRTRTR